MKNIANGAKMVSKLTWMHLCHYANEHRDKYPPLVIRGLFYACTIALAFMLAAIGLNLISGSTGRISEDIIMQAGTAFLFCLFCFLSGLISRAFLLSVPEVISTPTGEKTQRAIAAGVEWTPPDIAPDNLVCLLPGEQMEQYSNRFRKAEKSRAYAIWSVVIPPFSAECVILTGDESTDFFFSRGHEPFVDQLQEGERLPANLDHVRESLEQYQRYVDWFCAHYIRWVGSAKLEANHGRAQRTLLEIVEQKARTVALVFLAVLFIPALLGAQSKTRQVDENLGTRIRETPKPGDKVVFAFNEGGKEQYYYRAGDGNSEYTDLLRHAPGIGGYNDEGGTLLWIEKNGEVICRADHIQKVNESPVGPNREIYLTESKTGDPVRPRGTFEAPPAGTTRTDGPLTLSYPDSATLALRLDGVKNEIRQNRSKIWASVAPVWDFLMWCFGGLLIFLICAWGILNYIAGSAANESLVTVYGRVIAGRWIVAAQQNSAALCLVVCWIIVITMLINEFLWLVWLDIPLWTLLILWFPSLWLAKRMTDWAVPNLKVVGGGGGRGLIKYQE